MIPLKAFLTLLVISNFITLIVLNIATRSGREVILTEDFLTNHEIENQGTPATNPLVLLGAYPEFNLNDHVLTKGTKYHWNLWGIYHDPQYCQKVDAFNLAHPENMFKNMNFFTDFPKGSLPRVKAMEKMVGGKVFPKVERKNPDKIRKFELSHEITNFFTETNLYTYFHVSKHFLCATQIGNHIPGVGYLVRKTEVIQKTKLFAQKYENQPQCFNKNEFFLPSYRLYNEKECKEFFDLINTQAYKDSLEKEPIQYLIKVGVGAHKSEGVFLLDENKTQSINQEYDFGLNCGKTGGNLIAQKYITNPLLLDMDNKFDFRIFMLIASTNPKIVYYHDGYLRVAVNTFDKSSKDRATHLTNTAVAKKVFAKVTGNETVNGMNLAQLKDYHLWYLSDLQDYLLEIGKITDKNWLDNYLRPAFQKVMVHLIRMTGEHFYKGSNVYELHGLDFMLDNDLNLWFIEDNSSPLLVGVKPDLMSRMLMDAYEIEYAYYRSRMKRVLEVVNKLQTKLKNKEEVDYESLKEEYQRAIKNRLEPEYQISKENTFVPILDETLPGSESLLGYLPPECL